MGIAVLGPVVVDGEAGRLGPRDRIVLAALASRPREVLTPDQLAEALWGDDLPGTWSKVIQGCVVRLGKVLGTEAIETSRLGYRLVVPADDVDATQFEQLVNRARELLTLGEPERAMYILDEALALWRGPALGELDGWEDARVECARLDELRRDAEELRVDAALRAGRGREVLGNAQRLVAHAPLRERRWALLALAQYQVGRQAEALGTLRQVRTVLADELGIDPGPDLVDLELAILRQDAALVAQVALPDQSAICPYQGLVPYDVRDGEAFFGRDDDIAEALRRLRDTGVLVVVGPSGSGKSSLVRAGVAAALEREGSRVVVVTPGTRPLDALTAVTSARPAPVLVVDQCEEVVTLCSEPAEQEAFFSELAAYAGQAPLVVALRADRMGEVSAHAPFARLVERGLFLLSAMGAEQLRACIEGPAHQAGLLLEHGLVDLLVREVEGEPGALPLLSHALRETWAHREGRSLTVAGYQASGGIRGAVARSAEEVYERVEPEHRAIVRDLMLRLVTPSVEGEAVRSRMPRRLVADDGPHRQMIDLLVEARLVTSDDGVLELAHEALARAWPRLRQWLDDDTEGRRILGHLTATADAWETMGRPDSELYRGVRLAQALDWRAQADPTLTQVEREFLAASHVQVDAEVHAARDQARREARAGRRTRRLAMWLAVALVLAVSAAGLATWYQHQADDRASEAAKASTASDANRLAALSRSVGSLDLSLLLAAAALRTAETPATQDGLLSSLVRHRRATQVVQLGQTPSDGELADRGRTLFFSSQNGVLAWDVGKLDKPRKVVAWDQPQDIAASPTDDLVALWTVDREERPQVGVFDSQGRRHLLVRGFKAVGAAPTTLGFSGDGRTLRLGVLRDLDGGSRRLSVREYDVASGDRVGTYPVLRAANQDHWMWTSFADDGSTALGSMVEGRRRPTLIDVERGAVSPLVVEPRRGDQWYMAIPGGIARGLEGGAVELYNERGRFTQRLAVHQSDVNDAVVSPDGRWAVTGDGSGRAMVWDIHPGTGLWAPREELTGHSGGINGVAIDPRGRTVVTVSTDGTAISWDVSPGAGFGAPLKGLGDRWISNRPEAVVPGELVVAPTRAAPVDGGHLGELVSATFLDPRTGEVVDEVEVGDTLPETANGSSVAVSPDRSLVAVTHGEGTVVLDTATREQVARIVLDDVEEFGERHPDLVWSTGWTPDGAHLLLGADGKQLNPDDGNLVVVDTATWKIQSERVDIGGSAQSMEVSPDEEELAVAMTVPPVEDAPPGTVKLLDAHTFELRRELEMGTGDHPFDISFSPDGSHLAVGTMQGKLYVFDASSGKVQHAPKKVHDDFVQQVEWLEDGRTVVSTGSDGIVSLYDTERGLVRVSMPASADLEQAYTFVLSASDAAVAALAGGQPGRIYPLDPRRWLDYACLVAGRDLTRDEWGSYLPGRAYERTCSDRS